MQSRRECLNTMWMRYLRARSRSQKSQILDELQETLGYARKYAIATLKTPPKSRGGARAEPRPLRYWAAMPVIQVVWEVVDYPCAGRLHPVLVRTAVKIQGCRGEEWPHVL
ncbi:integrase catalytic region [Kyrpidia tusciae DSM 2912]|uniref:Integrase catalytic region n=2 Tax=Kyrpidia TaxID=1129704 RepID=D5WUU1_KYRT2|nr:integrase catalytic region [Kyrpidia tusciae DSM 2912]